MAPWTSAAAYDCDAAYSMDQWPATKKALHLCGGDTSFCPGPYPTAARPELLVGCKLGRELFTFSYAATDAYGATGCDQ